MSCTLAVAAFSASYAPLAPKTHVVVTRRRLSGGKLSSPGPSSKYGCQAERRKFQVHSHLLSRSARANRNSASEVPWSRHLGSSFIHCWPQVAQLTDQEASRAERAHSSPFMNFQLRVVAHTPQMDSSWIHFTCVCVCVCLNSKGQLWPGLCECLPQRSQTVGLPGLHCVFYSRSMPPWAAGATRRNRCLGKLGPEACSYRHLVLALRRLKQEGHGFWTSLSYIVSPMSKNE